MKVVDLIKQLKNVPQDAEVNIERIHDIYFEKYHWKTTELDFGYETTEIIKASCLAKSKDKDSGVINRITICAHI